MKNKNICRDIARTFDDMSLPRPQEMQNKNICSDIAQTLLARPHNTQDVVLLMCC